MTPPISINRAISMAGTIKNSRNKSRNMVKIGEYGDQ
jgi:hypothetical protein